MSGCSQGRYSMIPVVFLLYSLIVFNLLTSSQSSLTKQRCSSTWRHLPQEFSLLPSKDTLQLWYPTMVGTDLRKAMAFYQVETIPTWWSWQFLCLSSARCWTLFASSGCWHFPGVSVPAITLDTPRPHQHLLEELLAPDQSFLCPSMSLPQRTPLSR